MQTIIHTWEAPGEEGRCAEREKLTRDEQTPAEVFICSATQQSSPLPDDVAGMQHQHARPSRRQREQESEELNDSTRWTEVAFCQRSWLKFLGPRMQGDVRRAGGVGLICMSGRLPHLQIGSHWACLSAPLAALLAYGATEGIHEHSRGLVSAPTATFYFSTSDITKDGGWLLAVAALQ